MKLKHIQNHTHTVIGVDLGGTNIRAGRLVNGKLMQHAENQVPQNNSSAALILQTISNTIKKVFTPDVEGIGIGVPGLVDKTHGVIHSIVNIPSFDYIEISSILRDIFHVPIHLENDTNCFALGEKYFGHGKGYQNMVGLSIGTGMSAGIIVDNILIEGNNSGSGEFGEIPYLDSKFEAYCSGQFFKEKAPKNGKALFYDAQHGDANALKLFSQFGMHLGKAMKVIVLTIDPEIVIIGGSVSKAHAFFHEAMMHELKDFTFKRTLEKLKIVYTDNTNHPIYGAASLVIQKLADTPIERNIV